MKKKFFCMVLLCLCMLAMTVPAFAAIRSQIIFIPHDDRPISFMQTADTIRKLDYDLIVPPQELLGNRTSPGKPDELWQWLMEQAPKANAAVISSDSMLYGSLVASRKHNLPLETVMARADKFSVLKEANPSLKIYTFGSIMRSPRSSAGGEEPGYYAKYGPDIFQLTSLADKKESVGLTSSEKRSMKKLQKEVPTEAINDWMERRQKNFAANQKMVELAKQDVFNYLALGRDDNAPFSQTHKESRLLSEQGKELGNSRFQALAGIDEIAMVMLTRAVNDMSWNIPLVAVGYADGVGGDTVPTYSDEKISTSINNHLWAAGAIPVKSMKRADLVLLVNTAKDGKTGEANDLANTTEPRENTVAFVNLVDVLLREGYPVAIADIAYANGADNALLAELEKRDLLNKLIAYGGWNTATNSTGVVLGQGILADKMTPDDKNKLLLVRLLDDWAYQANVRQVLAGEIGQMKGGTYSQLDTAKPAMLKSADQKINAFAKEHLSDFDFKHIKVDFPWNRMFEASVVAE